MEGWWNAPLQVGGDSLPQVEKLKHYGVLFTSDGRAEEEGDCQIRASSSVMRALLQSFVVKKELS